MKYAVLAGIVLMMAFGCSGKKAVSTAGVVCTRTMDTTYVTEEGTRIEKFWIMSPSMKREIRAIVVLPPSYDADADAKFPVLYTLHGGNAPYDTWAQMAKLRAQLKDKPFVYTCFDGDAGSSYIDSYYPVKTARTGEADTTRKASLFTTFFFDEFVPGIDSWYRIDPAKRGVTGFSMGGSGAFHYMLEKPDFFNSVSVLSSGFTDTRAMDEGRKARLADKLGPYEQYPRRYAAVDHYIRLEKLLQEGVQLPPLYSHCGTEDFLLESNRKMDTFLKEHNVAIEVVESEGAHNWKFWHPASIGVAGFHWAHFNK